MLMRFGSTFFNTHTTVSLYEGPLAIFQGGQETGETISELCFNNKCVTLSSLHVSQW